MPEYLEVYNLNNKFIGVKERKKFFKEIKKEFSRTGKITKKVKAIRLLLMNSAGRIYIQKRSRFKTENPGFYDKTVGGHLPKGYSWEMVVVKECSEELGFPAVVLSEKEFRTAVKQIDLDVIGIFRKVDYLPDFLSIRITKKGEFIQPHITKIYIGYYDGFIKFKDGEVSGIEVFSLPELKSEIKKNPERFTEDIKFMIKKYSKYLVPVR